MHNYIDDFIYEDFSYENDDYLDAYGDPYDYATETLVASSSDQTIVELFFTCLQPTFRDVFWQFLLPILLTNSVSIWLLQLTKCFQLNFSFDLLPRLVMILSGYFLLINHYKEFTNQLVFLTVVILLTSLLVSILLQLSNDNERSFLWVLWCQQLSIIALNEYFVFNWTEWIKLRSNLMLVLMKSISYYYESKLTNAKKETNKIKFIDSFTDFLSYLLHPCTIVLGIWHPHSSYSKLFLDNQLVKSQNNLIQNIYNSIGSLILSILFLFCSTCLIEYFQNILFEYLDALIGIFIENPKSLWWWMLIIKFLKAYSIAIQFHYSHYFICFLGQSMFDLWNLKLTITKPMSIEWPRSLVDVVVAWNIPMHQWLKRYVFQILKNRFNIYLTILATYFISSYLHGFNFQIWSVLLTLGLITQVEFKLRKLLSRTLSACVESKKCFYDNYFCYDEIDGQNEEYNYYLVCRSGHKRTEDLSFVRWLNLFFTIIALFNLAFLGATFDGQPDSSSIVNVWTVWKDLHFHSYISLTIMYALYKLLSWTL